MAASLVKLAYLELLGGLLMGQPMAGFVAFAFTLCLAPTALYADQHQPSAEGTVDASDSTPAISSDDMSSTFLLTRHHGVTRAPGRLAVAVSYDVCSLG